MDLFFKIPMSLACKSKRNRKSDESRLRHFNHYILVLYIELYISKKVRSISPLTIIYTGTLKSKKTDNTHWGIASYDKNSVSTALSFFM